LRIGLISDTHGSIPSEVKVIFKDVDLILHAGDICYGSLGPLDQLEVIAPVLASRGNEDNKQTLGDIRVKEKHVLTTDGIRLFLIHDIANEGFNSEPYWMVDKNQFNNVTKTWSGGITDIYIFGHTHKPVIDYRNDSLFINPGSATEPDHELIEGNLGTVGLLDIGSGNVHVSIVQLR
jgi:putative phosphoesterase